jgi:WD40 repeat protein
VIAYALARDEHNPQNRAPKVDFPWSRETDTVFRLHTCSNTPALAFDNADPSGRWLYSSSIDGRTFKWDLHTRAVAAVYQMGWCANVASPSTTPGSGGPGFTCACEGAGTIRHGAWGAMPLDTRAAHEMTLTEENSSLEPKPIKHYIQDISAHKKRFTIRKTYLVNRIYASTSDYEVSESENEETQESKRHRRLINPRQSMQLYCKIVGSGVSPALSIGDHRVRLPK